jgi:agmatinase
VGAPSSTFLNAPSVADATEVVTPYAFLGIPFGPPYELADLHVAAGAADAVRAATRAWNYAYEWSHHDFDYGRALFPDGVATVSDCGDVAADLQDPGSIAGRAIGVLRPLVRAGVVPLVVGGLDSVPPMVVSAFGGHETVHVLHVDAHLDFRDEVGGVREGYSSPIRRIRELDGVDRIVQVGLRSMGSARPSDVDDALAAGNRLVTAWELHGSGAGAFVASLPEDRRFVVTIDCDGLDPSIAPGVGWPEPGGLTYVQIGTILRRLAIENRVAALVFTEFQPARDVAGTTAHTIARLLMNVMGLQPEPSRPVAPRTT